MKVLLYLEAENYLRKSGIGRAIKHQEFALKYAGQDYTKNSDDNYDLIHINTYGFKSWRLLKKSRRLGKKVIMHGHSTEEDFRDSFIGSNFVAPLFKWYLCQFYKSSDAIITPTKYSKSLIQSYGIKVPIFALSNGIDLDRYTYDQSKVDAFRKYFNLSSTDKVVVSAGLYFKRKGIDEFVEVARRMPNVTFIWFGETNKYVIPSKVRAIVRKNHPKNVIFAGYIKGDVFEGAMSGSDAFFFPSREETEGIVVLEALASRQNVLLRDIPVYNGWLDSTNCLFSNNVEGFVTSLKNILDGQVDKRQEGYRVAESRDIRVIASKLVSIYKKVMEL